MTASEAEIVARKRALWQGRAKVARFVEETEPAYGPQHLKNLIETDIIRRFMLAGELLDVGIGTGRVSFPLIQEGVRITGLDASAAMLEACATDPRASQVQLVHAELSSLPFEAERFDTVISVDTFTHFPGWEENLDELLRVTRRGGRIIIDVGSREHTDAVAQFRGDAGDNLRGVERRNAERYILRLSRAQLLSYAVEREISLVGLVSYGAVFGSLVPNHWMTDSYAFRSGGMDRLVSWIGADPLLFSAAEFIERRIVQHVGPSVSDRMFAVFQRQDGAEADGQPLISETNCYHERGQAVWNTELDAHMQHEPNRVFAIALLMAAWPIRLTAPTRAVIPDLLLRELERVERARQIDDICAQAIAAWRVAAPELTEHGVDLSSVFALPLERELRRRLEADG